MNVLRIPSPTDRRIVAESLERVQMTEFQNRQIGELFRDKKRTFLACLSSTGNRYAVRRTFYRGRCQRQKTMIELLIELGSWATPSDIHS